MSATDGSKVNVACDLQQQKVHGQGEYATLLLIRRMRYKLNIVNIFDPYS